MTPRFLDTRGPRALFCLVCDKRLDGAGFLCKACGDSYDRAVRKDETTASIIKWAVERALRVRGKR